MPIKKTVKAKLMEARVITEDSNAARELFNQSCFGILLEDNTVQLNMFEALHLLEKKKINIKDGRKKVTKDILIAHAQKIEPKYWTKYCVYNDLRTRGYTVKTALKFGADFRVYGRGVKPGEDHAKWIVFPVQESEALTWYEFAAKNRVAHSTKKRLLMGIVDEENSVTYYEIRWVRP